MKTSLLLCVALFTCFSEAIGQDTESWFAGRLDSLRQVRAVLSVELKKLDQEIDSLTWEWQQYQNSASRNSIEHDFELALKRAMSIAENLNYAFLIDHALIRGNLETQRSGFMVRIYNLDRENVKSLSLKALPYTQNSHGIKTVVGDTVQVDVDMASFRDKQITDYRWSNLWEYTKGADIEVIEASVSYIDSQKRLIKDLSCYWIWRHVYELECK